VKVWNPSYHFRQSLKRLDPRAHGFRSAWTVIGFGRDMPAGAHQSLTAHEIACEGAPKVMIANFPDEQFQAPDLSMLEKEKSPHPPKLEITPRGAHIPRSTSVRASVHAPLTRGNRTSASIQPST
jgi:hypothetical protein